MNIIEIATDIIVLLWVMLVTAYTMLLNKKVDAIRDERLRRINDNKELLELAIANVDEAYNKLEELETYRNRIESVLKIQQGDLSDINNKLEDSDRRTVNGMKQHKEALRELYEYAQKAGEIRSGMLSKITDLERWVQAHEARHIEQEEEQWKD